MGDFNVNWNNILLALDNVFGEHKTLHLHDKHTISSVKRDGGGSITLRRCFTGATPGRLILVEGSINAGKKYT